MATHTAPRVIAMPAGPEPTAIGPPGWPVAGSIRVTVPSSLFATQTASGPTAMPSGRPPTGTVFVTLPVAGIDPAHGVVAFVGHPHAAAPAGDGDRQVADLDRLDDGLSTAALIRDTVPSPLLVTHTFSTGDGYRGRRGANRDLVQPRHG